MAHAHGRHLHPEDPERRAAETRMRALPLARRRRRGSLGGGARRGDGRAGPRAAAGVARTHPRVSDYTVGQNAVVYPGTIIGAGCQIGDNVVLGKPPALSSRSTAKREELPPLELGEGTIVSTGAVVFAGTRIGARSIIGDQSCVRERCDLGA